MARFTMSLKLTFGFTHPSERIALHASHLEEKIGEMNVAFWPDLIIMDGRSSFVTRGPDRGKLVHPKLILASGDRVAIDVEGVKVLQSYKEKNELNMPAWELPQIKHAIKMRVGAKDADHVRVIRV